MISRVMNHLDPRKHTLNIFIIPVLSKNPESSYVPGICAATRRILSHCITCHCLCCTNLSAGRIPRLHLRTAKLTCCSGMSKCLNSSCIYAVLLLPALRYRRNRKLHQRSHKTWDASVVGPPRANRHLQNQKHVLSESQLRVCRLPCYFPAECVEKHASMTDRCDPSAASHSVACYIHSDRDNLGESCKCTVLSENEQIMQVTTSCIVVRMTMQRSRL